MLKVGVSIFSAITLVWFEVSTMADFQKYQNCCLVRYHSVFNVLTDLQHLGSYSLFV